MAAQSILNPRALEDKKRGLLKKGRDLPERERAGNLGSGLNRRGNQPASPRFSPEVHLKFYTYEIVEAIL